jgi:phosphoribosylformimino-5-aminoimidazole carboxamide ribonucleotide (ProFAR) isomerase
MVRYVFFHYGGHAGGQQLDLEGGAGQALGLAHLLGRQATQQLQIVFLNGCSTKEQVDRLLKLGVKVIIATSVAIKDKKAVEFAYRFYRKLANNGSIRQAFDNACDGTFVKI